MHTEIILPLKTATKTPVDKKFICRDMAEALQNAYPGYICYLESTGKFYRFLNTNKLHEWQVFNIEDYATRADITAEIAKLVNGSPEVLDTLAEIAAALNNDKDFGQTMINELVKKVDKIAGMGLSERSFTQEEKNKLAELHNYTHPATHPATIITQDANNRFVTDAEKTNWNAKADKATATTANDGLMSKEDKLRLDNLQVTGNNYTHPDTHPATIITQDANNRFVTDAEKANWNAKADKATATTANDGLMDKADKSKLDGIQAGATNYTHPATHPATIITQDANNRFVTDAEKTNWNAKADKATATTANDGLMAKADKTKLDGIQAGATSYTHPANHPATVITQDANNRFVTDAEKANWNDKYTRNEVENKLSALITSLDWKEAVANFTALATTYPTPEQGWTVNVKDVNKNYTYNGTAWIQTGGAIPLVTTAVDGLMTAGDKAKLDGIQASATNYTHPATHPATIITQDANNRFVTDAEKANWNAKADKTTATTANDGLMAKADKSKLDGIQAGATNYTHPANHPASIITQDANNRFVTDAEKALFHIINHSIVNPDNMVDNGTCEGRPFQANHPNNCGHGTLFSFGKYQTSKCQLFISDDNQFAYRIKNWAGIWLPWVVLSATATTANDGLMAKADKTKLDRITGGKVTVGSTIPTDAVTGDIWIKP